jgi:hypothetical protein
MSDPRFHDPEYIRAARFMFLRAACLGLILGLTLLFLDAPLWVFYVAPLVLMPWLFWELPRLDRITKKDPDTSN